MVIHLKRKKNHVKERNKFLKKMFTNVKDEAHGNNQQPKMPLKKLNVCLLVFEMKIKAQCQLQTRMKKKVERKHEERKKTTNRTSQNPKPPPQTLN